MALKLELKPGERFILGQTVVTNEGARTRLTIEGNAPILREKDILVPDDANSPAKRIYLAVQMMYLSGDANSHLGLFHELISDFLTAAPSSLSYIEAISKEVLTGNAYKALKEAKALVAYEEELLAHVLRR